MKSPVVLLVEDDETIRGLYKDALEFSGLKVIIAKNGEDGVTVALKNHPDLIVVDLLMPEMNGHEMMEKIRLDPWGKKAKVVFLTNLTDPKDVFHAVELKPEEYIVKSNADIKEAVNKIRTAIHS
jgi:DNA-binding response OmpR family regulator